MAGQVPREVRGVVRTPYAANAKRRAKAKERETLRAALLGVRRGDPRALGMAEEDVKRISVYASRTIDLPPFFGLEDVKQEVRIHLWRAAVNWDPARGVPLVTHALWNAISGSRKRMHEVRSANGKRSSKEPSRYPRAFSGLMREGDDGREYKFQERVLGNDGGRAAELAEAIVHYRELLAELDPEEAFIVQVLVEEGGSSERAAFRILNEEEPRKLLRIDRYEQADRRVTAAVERLRMVA